MVVCIITSTFIGIRNIPEGHSQVIHIIDGMKNLSDGMIVYRTDQGDHNIKLAKVLDRLMEMGLAFNQENRVCENIVFLGHIKLVSL